MDEQGKGNVKGQIEQRLLEAIDRELKKIERVGSENVDHLIVNNAASTVHHLAEALKAFREAYRE